MYDKIHYKLKKKKEKKISTVRKIQVLGDEIAKVAKLVEKS